MSLPHVPHGCFLLCEQICIFVGETLLFSNWAITADILMVSHWGSSGGWAKRKQHLLLGEVNPEAGRRGDQRYMGAGSGRGLDTELSR